MNATQPAHSAALGSPRAIAIEIPHLYVSPGHNFFGRHAKPPGRHPAIDQAAIDCLAGRGVAGDRFLDYKGEYKGQITFFSMEVYEGLCRKLGVYERDPSVFRRNALVRGIDLNSLIGRVFQVGRARFCGVEECKPCYWMDQAFGPGAEGALRGRGGLRARILTSGRLRKGANTLVLEPADREAWKGDDI